MVVLIVVPPIIYLLLFERVINKRINNKILATIWGGWILFNIIQVAEILMKHI
jgi:hypothetical protein